MAEPPSNAINILRREKSDLMHAEFLGVRDAAFSGVDGTSPHRGSSYQLASLMKFCSETRDLVDTVTRRQIYLSYKDAVYETFPLFLPRLRDGHERAHRAVDAKESGASRIFDLDDIKDFIEDHLARGHLINEPPSARLKLVQDLQDTWISHTKKCIQVVQDTLLEVILPLALFHLGEWTYLHSLVRSIITDLIGHHGAICQSFVISLLDAERTPYTQNIDEFKVTRDAWMSKYEQDWMASDLVSACLPITSPPRDEPWSEDHWVSLLSPGWMRWKERSLADPYGRELTVMAEVLAYFHISCERVVDVVPMMIEFKLIESFCENVQTALLKRLIRKDGTLERQ